MISPSITQGTGNVRACVCVGMCVKTRGADPLWSHDSADCRLQGAQLRRDVL